MMAPPTGRHWTPAAEHFVQHQLAQVTNFWRLGLPAEFHLVSQSSGTAELKLTFPLRAPCETIPPPSAPKTFASGSECLKKANKSRVLRRERRAAERAAAEKDAAEKSVAENTNPKMVVAEPAAAPERAAARTAAAKAGAEKATDMSDAVASTSCIASRCLNREGQMSADHQCEVPPSNPPTVTHEQLPSPLPLCHYCCHLGSGENPVHYYLQCLCSDNPCSCQCYCSKEQLIHRKLFYPVDFSDGKPIDPCDRPQALAIAEARCERNYGHRPCESENCVKPV